MGMTMAQRILVKTAGLPDVEAGQLGEENDITGKTNCSVAFLEFANGIISSGGLFESLKARGVAK